MTPFFGQLTTVLSTLRTKELELSCESPPSQGALKPLYTFASRDSSQPTDFNLNRRTQLKDILMKLMFAYAEFFFLTFYFKYIV